MAAKRRRRKPRAREREDRPKKSSRSKRAARTSERGKKKPARSVRKARSRERPKRPKKGASKKAPGRKPARAGTPEKKKAKPKRAPKRSAAKKKPSPRRAPDRARRRTAPARGKKTAAAREQRHRVWIPEHVRSDSSVVRGHYRFVAGKKKRPARPKKPAKRGKPLATETIAEVPRKPKRKPRKRAVALPQEILDQRLLDFRRRLRQEGKIRPPRGHSFGDMWISRIDGRIVLHKNVVIAMRVDEGNVEEIVHRIMGALRSALLVMRGTMYASLYMFEYGREIVGSPGEMFFEDEEGFMWESFRGIPGSPTLAVFEDRLRSELEEQAAHEKSSVWLEHVTIRIARSSD
jgi:hypothetical protein